MIFNEGEFELMEEARQHDAEIRDVQHESRGGRIQRTYNHVARIAMNAVKPREIDPAIQEHVDCTSGFLKLK